MLRHREDLRPLFFHAVYFGLLAFAFHRGVVDWWSVPLVMLLCRDLVSGRGPDTQRHPLAGVSRALAEQALPGGANAHLRTPRQFLCAGSQPESPQTYPDPPRRDADDEDPLPLQRLQRAVLLLGRRSQHHAGGRAVHGLDAKAPSSLVPASGRGAQYPDGRAGGVTHHRLARVPGLLAAAPSVRPVGHRDHEPAAA